jgi:transposase-like protein
VANRAIYLAIGVTVDGERDILGLWAGEHGDGEAPSTHSRSQVRDQFLARGELAQFLSAS